MSDTRADTESTRRTEPERDGRDTLNSDMMQWVSALVALAGLGLVAYPFMFEATEAAIWNDTILGTAIFLLGGYNFYRLSKDRLANSGAAILAALLGLWALISPAVIEMGSDELAMATAAGGLVTAVLAAYSAYANRSADTTERTTTHT